MGTLCFYNSNEEDVNSIRCLNEIQNRHIYGPFRKHCYNFGY